MLLIRKILCPTDLSSYCQPVIATGCEWAQRFQAELHLLHVVDGLLHPASYVGPPFDTTCDWEDAVRQRAQTALDQMPLPADLPPESIVRSLRMGSCATSIVTYATEAGIDLLILGTHGRTGLSHLLLGSLAENVASRVPCSVLTVHPLDATPRVTQIVR